MTAFSYYDYRLASARAAIFREIKFYHGCEWAATLPIQEYLTYLHGRVDKTHQNIAPTLIDGMGNRLEIEKFDINKKSKEFDIQVFKKPWNKMREIHKIIKIREFVSNLKYRSTTDPELIERNRKRLIRKLILGIKEKRFSKKGCEIIYDIENMMIESVSCVWYDRNRCIYRIEW